MVAVRESAVDDSTVSRGVYCLRHNHVIMRGSGRIPQSALWTLGTLHINRLLYTEDGATCTNTLATLYTLKERTLQDGVGHTSLTPGACVRLRH